MVGTLFGCSPPAEESAQTPVESEEQVVDQAETLKVLNYNLGARSKNNRPEY